MLSSFSPLEIKTVNAFPSENKWTYGDWSTFEVLCIRAASTLTGYDKGDEVFIVEFKLHTQRKLKSLFKYFDEFCSSSFLWALLIFQIIGI